MTISGRTGNCGYNRNIVNKINNKLTVINTFMKTNLKIDENYYLTTQVIDNGAVTVNVAKQINHIFVVDVSGSMYNELGKIRTQLKNKLSNLMKDGDTISIVWFSGKNDAGILKEEVEVKSLKTLSDLNNAIDKWLNPIGLTAFNKPLILVNELIGRIKKNRPDGIFSLIFLSDGYNNDCSWSDVIASLKRIENEISSATFVEYGYYADSRRLTEMAGILGGEKISCNGFDEFEPIFAANISKNIYGGKKSLVNITDSYLYDFAFSVANDSVLLYNIADNKIMVGSDVNEIHFFSKTPIGHEKSVGNTILYGATYILADKLMNDDAEKIFYVLGDNFYYKMLSNAFGKQKLNEFKSAIKECVTDVSKRFLDGKGTINKIDDNAYCLMNLINDLGNMEHEFYPNHPKFEYNRIGRGKIATSEILTDAEKLRISEAKNVEEASAIINEIKESKVSVKFVNSNPNRGYPMSDVVWNEERANLSIRIYIEGEAILPTNKFGIDKVSSFKYNTFTIIKDGIVNIDYLPVSTSVELVNLLRKNNVIFDIDFDNNVTIIDLKSLPIINRGMVNSISANVLAKKEWELVKLQASKKVFDYFKKKHFPKTSKSFTELLGQEASDWLKEIGITDFNGFAPKSILKESTDFYMSVNLITKIKGLSSLPKVEDVINKIKSNKDLKINELVMSDAIKRYFSQIESDTFKTLNEEQQNNVLNTYLNTNFNLLNKQKRAIMEDISKIKFSLILSKKWFKEFASFDENQLTLKLDGHDLTFTFDLLEKEEEI